MEGEVLMKKLKRTWKKLFKKKVFKKQYGFKQDA